MAGASAVRRLDYRHPTLLPDLLITLVALLLGALNIITFTDMSPIDEAAHYDYLVKFPEVPLQGEQLGQDAMETEACYGIALDASLPECGLPEYDPAAFPGGGYSTAGIHPPVYYALTSVAGRAVAAIFDVSFLVATRAVGVMWLIAFGLVTRRLATRSGVSRMMAGAVTILAISTPQIVTSATTLGPDIAAATAGALIILAATEFRGTWGQIAILTLFSAFGAMVKLTVLLAVGVACCIVIGKAAWGVLRPPPWPRVAATVSLLVISFLMTSRLWSQWFESNAIVAADQLPLNQWFMTDELPLGNLFAHVLMFFSPISGGYFPAYLGGIATDRISSIVPAILVVGALSAALGGRADRDLTILGSATVFIAAIGAPILVVGNFVENGMYFAIASRYALPITAAFMCCTAKVFDQHTGVRRTMVLLAVVSVATFLLQANPISIGSL